MEKLQFRILTIFTMIASVLILNSCIQIPPELPDPTESTTPPDIIEDWYHIYFTNPDDPNAKSYRGGPDEWLAQAIDSARISVDVAVYHLNLWSIRDALIDAHNRGLSVRMVTESDNFDEIEVQEIAEAGIPIIGDRRESLMHHKFVIIDGTEVWTGSMNFTTTGAYQNDNNLLQIQSAEIAENFTAEFEEMFENDFFGNDILSNTPNPSVQLDSSQIETYFSPDDYTEDRMVELIDRAEDEIAIMAFTITSDPISDALINAHIRGVNISGVLEESQYYSNIGNDFDRLVETGLDLHLDQNTFNMHHKVMVIDQETVVTGSYNFSRSASEFNDENTLIIWNQNIAQQFLKEFKRISPDQ